MSNTVSDILTLMDAGKIPANDWKSRHLYPNDVELKDFSIFAFKKMSGRLTPYYRYKEMKITGGANSGLGWLLRQPAGYFIVYGITNHSKPPPRPSTLLLSITLRTIS